jgi:hypothetical protein
MLIYSWRRYEWALAKSIEGHRQTKLNREAKRWRRGLVSLIYLLPTPLSVSPLTQLHIYIQHNKWNGMGKKEV